MNGKDLMEGLSHLDEAYIAQAASAERRRSVRFFPYAMAAACLCLLCVGAWQLWGRDLAGGPKTEHLQVEFEGENAENPAGPSDGTPWACPGEQVELVVDHWEKGICYLRVPEQKEDLIPAVLQEGVPVPESIQSGSLVTVTVAAWDPENGILYVSKIEQSE